MQIEAAVCSSFGYRRLSPVVVGGGVPLVPVGSGVGGGVPLVPVGGGVGGGVPVGGGVSGGVGSDGGESGVVGGGDLGSDLHLLGGLEGLHELLLGHLDVLGVGEVLGHDGLGGELGVLAGLGGLERGHELLLGLGDLHGVLEGEGHGGGDDSGEDLKRSEKFGISNSGEYN